MGFRREKARQWAEKQERIQAGSCPEFAPKESQNAAPCVNGMRNYFVHSYDFCTEKVRAALLT